MDYKARFYSPYLNRFLQPDSIIPNPANPQSMNRFGYVLNNPIRFSDPTGHKEYDEIGGGIPCYPGELVCQLMKGDGGGPSGENSDNDLVLDEEDVIDEPSYQWEIWKIATAIGFVLRLLWVGTMTIWDIRLINLQLIPPSKALSVQMICIS